MVRKEYQKRRQYLKEHEKDAVKIQAVWRGHKAQKSYKQRLEYLNQQKDKALLVGPCVIMVATHMYMYICTWCTSINASVFIFTCVVWWWCGVCIYMQIQSVFRMHRARKAYKERLQLFKSHVSTIVAVCWLLCFGVGKT